MAINPGKQFLKAFISAIYTGTQLNTSLAGNCARKRPKSSV